MNSHSSTFKVYNKKIPVSGCLVASLAALILCPTLALGVPQNINGELSTSDFLATDSSSNTYYYDLYELTNPTASSVTVTISIDAGALLSPWSSYWSTSLLPAPDFESPVDIYAASEEQQSSVTAGDTLSFTAFNLPAGATYQLAIGTLDYNEAGAQLDTYLLSVDGTGVEVDAIPVPSSLPLQSTSIIALEGDSVPEGDGTFSSFNAPVLNDPGQVAFRGSLTGTPGGSSDNLAIYRGTSSATLEKIVRTGDLFNGVDAVGDLLFTRPSMNNLGQIAIYGKTAAENDDLLLRSSVDGLSLTEIARYGDTAPNGDGEFGFFDTIAINSSGTVAFYTSLNNAANPNEFEGLYKSDGTTTTKIVRSAQEAPEILTIESLAFNDSGQVSFYADTWFSGDAVLYRGDGSSLTELLRTGDALPDAGGGTLGFPNFPTMNESGDIAFGTNIDGVPFSADQGVYRTASGSFEKIIQEGDPAPVGLGTFGNYSGEPIINNSGDVAFVGFMRDGASGYNGIFVGDGTTLVQAVREGNNVPEGTAQFRLFDDLSFNNYGQAVFESTLQLTANGSSDDVGLYFYDPIDGLMKIAREGDTLLGSTITFLSYASINVNTVNIEETGFNDAGQVAYRFVLADGREGIALWSGPNRSTSSAESAAVITSFDSVSGNTWELTLQGEADTAYEFRSSTTLDFTPGTLVESLVQGDATNDPGTVTDGNQLTLDSNGDGTVRMTLTGSENFVRAQATASP